MPCFLRNFVALSLFLLFSASLTFGDDILRQKTADGYADFSIPASTDNKAYMDYFVPPVSFWIMETEEVQALFSNTGQFGQGFLSNPDCDGEICPSFESPANSGIEYLFCGAIWIGGVVGDDTLVTVAADGWFGVRELWPDNSGMEFDGLSDYSAWANFTDTIVDADLGQFDPIDNRLHEPLNLRFSNRAHVWNTDPEHNLVIYDMVVTNTGDIAIHDGYIGFYFDADVYHFSNGASGFADDVAGALRDECIAYIIDNDGDPDAGVFNEYSPTRLFAFKFLDTSFDPVDTNFNWWISNGNASLDFGPRLAGTPEDPFRPFNAHLGTPTGDPNKYYILSHKEFDYDQVTTAVSHEGEGFLPPPVPSQAVDFADGYDARFLMSIGPFDLDPDSSMRILYTTFTGEGVHQVPDNIDNIYIDPDVYLANLDFSDVLTNAAAADMIVPLLIGPTMPPMGLRVLYDSDDSVVVEWDPYGYAGIDGYEVYLHKIPADSMPYPDAIPPWLELDDLSVMTKVADNGMVYRYKFDTLQTGHFYFASVANHTTGGTGDLCDPIVLRPGGRIPAPVPDNKFLFVDEGSLAAIKWSEPEGVDIDHYNIYRQEFGDTIPGLYNPFYDTGEFSAIEAPVDSFFRDGQWYYYYAMEAYGQTDSGITGFSDYPTNYCSYNIVAVDKSGHESDFSDSVVVFLIDPYTPKEILVINCSGRDDGLRYDRVLCDSLEYFYEYIIGGMYDHYFFSDTMSAYGGWKSDFWIDLLPYELVILDGGFEGDVLSEHPLRPTAWAFERYIHSGGKLAYFGSLSTLLGFTIFLYPTQIEIGGSWFVDEYFGIDSVTQAGLLCYYGGDLPPYPDTLLCLSAATPLSVDVPYLEYNPLVNCLGIFSELWPVESAPAPSAFVVNEQGIPLYLAETTCPENSMIEGYPIGVKTEVAGTATYLFGFHLWYMNPDSAALLIDYLLYDSPSNGDICGDANGDFVVDVGDIVYLVNFMFLGGWPPLSEPLCDVNGDTRTNVGDIVYLVNYIFRGGLPPSCL